MAYQIKEKGGFSPFAFWKNQGFEKMSTNFSRLGRYEPPSLAESQIIPKRVENHYGFEVTEMVFTDGSDTRVLLALDLSSSSFALKKSWAAKLGKNRKTMDAVPHAALSLGPVTGDYNQGFPERTRYQYYTGSGQEEFGPGDVQDRFVGLDALLNVPFSGGVVLQKDGPLQVVDQDGIREGKEKGLPAAQALYSFSDNTAATLLNQRWNFFNESDKRIGSSPYSWSWYYQDSDKLLYVCTKGGPGFHNNFLTLDGVNVVNFLLANERPWRAALADSGLGGGFIIRSGNGNNAVASHPNPEVFHTVPAALIAYPGRQK